MSFLHKEVSESDKAEIKKQAEKILDSFAAKLEKIDVKMAEPIVERDFFEREEGAFESDESFSREIMFENAPEKNKDFIIGEKKGW